MKIGNAKYHGDRKKKTYAKLKDGEAMYRILPPLGDLADKGIWKVFWNVHYGYTNTAGKLRTFASPLVKNRKGMIEVPDAALERIEKMKAQLEQAKKDKNNELVAKFTALVSGTKPKFNMDKNHYMNAVDASGNIVILQLRHKAFQALEIEIKALRDQGIDPLGVQTGRYFVFRRTGMALDTTFKVSVAQETLDVPNVGPVKKDRVHALTEELIARLENEAADLDKLYRTPTAEEVARIVAEGSKAVDDILDRKFGEADDQEDAGSADEIQTVAPTTITKKTETVAAAKAEAKTASAPPPVSSAVNNMSDDEFLKSLNL